VLFAVAELLVCSITRLLFHHFRLKYDLFNKRFPYTLLMSHTKLTPWTFWLLFRISYTHWLRFTLVFSLFANWMSCDRPNSELPDVEYLHIISNISYC